MTRADMKRIRHLLGMPDPKHFVSRRYAPHQRCGICQEPFGPDDRTVLLDDEKVHRDCNEDELVAFDPLAEGGGQPCERCGIRQEPWRYSSHCQACLWDLAALTPRSSARTAGAA